MHLVPEIYLQELTMNTVGDLSNEELLVRLRTHVRKGHAWQAGLLAYLAEVDHRELYRQQACSSMWDLCTRTLGMSASEAHRRIAVARVVRRFPLAFELLSRGEVHLCALYALRDHLTDENHETLLRGAVGKTTHGVELMIAARFPRSDVPARIEHVESPAWLPVPSGDLASEARTRVEPLSATRYRMELTISDEMRAKLERIKDLMLHRNPTGDLETILDASLDLLLAKLERERLGKSSRPRKTKAQADTSTSDPYSERKVADGTSVATADTSESEATGAGSILVETRREVFARDGEQCTYEDANGNRCPARGFLELDHVRSKARGGRNDSENLRVRCRAHNQLHAEEVFGRAHVKERIESRRRRYDAGALPRFQIAARALRSLGFRNREVQRAIVAVRKKLDDATAPLEMIVREALRLLTRPLTTPEN